MTAFEQHVALIELHSRLMDVLDASPNGTVHPSHVGGVITDLLAYVIVDAAQAEHAETVTEEFTGMLRRRVAHYLREAAQEDQNEFDWPGTEDLGAVQ